MTRRIVFVAFSVVYLAATIIAWRRGGDARLVAAFLPVVAFTFFVRQEWNNSKRLSRERAERRST